MRERSKKAPSTSKDHEYIRLVRIKIRNSHHPAYQIERIKVSDDKVTGRELLDRPDTLEMVLAKSNEALDPEAAIKLEPVVA